MFDIFYYILIWFLEPIQPFVSSVRSRPFIRTLRPLGHWAAAVLVPGLPLETSLYEWTLGLGSRRKLYGRPNSWMQTERLAGRDIFRIASMKTGIQQLEILPVTCGSEKLRESARDICPCHRISGVKLESI
jgi:hypothetical protein